jgi:putative phosphoribosyl transferase
MLPFANRFGAGRLLGQALAHHASTKAVVLGIAYGGLAVADGVAHELGLGIDVWFARKLRAVAYPSLVIGVIAEGWSLVLDREAVARAELTDGQIRALAQDTAEQIALDARRHRGMRAPIDMRGKTAIIVDDGIVTGGTLAASAGGVRKCGAAKVVLAAPVGRKRTVDTLSRDVDELVCLSTPLRMRRVGAWYQDYRQVTERSAVKILRGI